MARILLVEDDPMIAEIYMKKLTGAGFEAVNAKTGKEVLKYASEQKFDLVLLDMVIPEMSGMDVLKELKKSGNYDSNIKVIVFSNLGEAEIRQEATENGSDGFIEKAQFGPTELVNEVNRQLNLFAEREKNRKRLSGELPTPAEGDRKKVLLIEDEEIFLDMFGKKIKDEGYEVVFANNGAWGLKEAMEEDFNVIITDMMMPAMTGDEIVAKLRENDRTKNVPIIVLSASIDPIEQRRIEEMKISKFFIKTQIVPSDLTRCIEEILKSEKTPKE